MTNSIRGTPILSMSDQDGLICAVRCLRAVGDGDRLPARDDTEGEIFLLLLLLDAHIHTRTHARTQHTHACTHVRTQHAHTTHARMHARTQC